jgi:hypothetical protein
MIPLMRPNSEQAATKTDVSALLVAPRASTVTLSTTPTATVAIVGRPATDEGIPTASAASSADTGETTGAVAIPRWLQILGAVIAPSSLITALSFYFGKVRTDTYFDYLGIDRSMLNFTTQDYLLRSTDVLFIPLGALLSVGVLILWTHCLVEGHLSKHPRVLQYVTRGLVVLGGGLFAIGAVNASRQGLPFPTPFLFAQLSLGVGVALVAYALRLRGKRLRGWISTVYGTLIGLLILLSLFSTTAEYAAALGTGRAQEFAAGLFDRPAVVVYSKDRLHIEAPGVVETTLEGVDSAYRYRYTGLRSLLRSGGNYFLLPALWSYTNDGVTVILPETTSIRLQFAKGARS